VHLYLVVHPWLFSLSARLHLGYKHVTGCNPVLHSLSSLSPFPTELQHFDYPLPAVDRSWVRYACSTFLIFPNAETLPVGHKKITEPINAVRRLGDALVHIVHIDRMSSSLSVWFPFPCSCVLAPVIIPTCVSQGAGVSAAAWPCCSCACLLAYGSSPPPSFLLSLGTFLWVPCS